jgi:hypothetical protein
MMLIRIRIHNTNHRYCKQVHVKDGLVSKESLFLTDMLEEVLEKLPAMLRSVSAGSIQVLFIPDPDFLPMPDPGSRGHKRHRIPDPDVSTTTPVVHIELRISLCEFSKKLERDRYSERLGGY